MLRRSMLTALLTSSLLFGFLTLALTSSTVQAKAVGTIVTVTAIDPRTGMATVVAKDGGETFAVAKDSLWKVGTQLQCDRVSDNATPYLDRCILW